MLGVVDWGDKTQIDTPHWLRATPKISRQMTASSAVQKRPIVLTQLQEASESSAFLGQILGSRSFHLSSASPDPLQQELRALRMWNLQYHAQLFLRICRIPQ